MADTSLDHQHTTFDEQLFFAFSIAARTLCAVAAAYIFFGTTYLPAACGVDALVGGTKAFIIIGVATVVTAYVSTYGTNWTPATDKYEWIDAMFLIVLGIVVAFGVVKNWGAVNTLMEFTAWMFGALIVLGIGFDWIARLVKRRAILRAEAATRTPTT